MKLKFFKSGRHTDKNGFTKEFTDNDLTEIVSNYNQRKNENKDDAPIVIGHPDNNSPALGWIDSIEKIGEWLYASVKDVSQELINKISDNQYKHLSASIRDNNTIRHIGFVPVASIKETAILEYNENEKYGNYTFEYSEKKGNNMDLQERIAELEKILKEKEDKIASLEKNVSSFSEQEKTINILKEQVDTQQKVINAMHQAQKDKEINDFCEQMRKEGKLTPAEFEITIDELKAHSKNSDFSEQNSLYTRKKKIISERKPIIDNTPIKVDNDFSEEDSVEDIERRVQKMIKDENITREKAIEKLYTQKFGR